MIESEDERGHIPEIRDAAEVISEMYIEEGIDEVDLRDLGHTEKDLEFM